MLAFCSRRIEPVRQSNRRYITSLHATDSVLATYNGGQEKVRVDGKEQHLEKLDHGL